MEENEDGGVYYDCYKVSPSLTYSVDICKDVLCNGSIGSFNRSKYKASAVFCLQKGSGCSFCCLKWFTCRLGVLSGDMEIAAHHMKHSQVNQEVLHKRHINFIRLHREYELGRKLPCAVLEHYEHCIFLVANPIVRRLMGQLIMRYIFGGSDFEPVANEKVQYYERYKDRPCRFLSMTPVYTFRDDATMEAPNDEMRNLNLKS